MVDEEVGSNRTYPSLHSLTVTLLVVYRKRTRRSSGERDGVVQDGLERSREAEPVGIERREERRRRVVLWCVAHLSSGGSVDIAERLVEAQRLIGGDHGLEVLVTDRKVVRAEDWTHICGKILHWRCRLRRSNERLSTSEGRVGRHLDVSQ